MSPNVNRIMPPSLVLVATLYFGWPPSAPLIQSDSTVRATAVRWKLGDLKDPPPVSVKIDPFASVLFVSSDLEVEDETGKLVPASRPAGPEPSELQQGLALTGIATMGGRKWAILNGRPRLPGDAIVTDDINHHRCEVVSVGQDHVVVRCEETIAKIEIGKSNRTTSASQLPGVILHPMSESQQATSQQPDVGNADTEQAVLEEATEIPPPPSFFESLGALVK